MIRFEQYFESSSEMMLINDMNGMIVKVNTAWKRKLGYNKSDLQGKPFIDFVHRDDVAPTLARFEHLLKVQKDTGFINRYRRKDGKYIFVEWDVTILPDMMVSLAKDVTERELLKKKLEESEERLKMIFNSTSSVVALIREQDRVVVELNTETEKLTGKSREELVGNKFEFSSFWSDGVGISLFEAVLLPQGHVENFPATMNHPEKGRRRYLLSANLLDYLGEPHFLFVANDYTDFYEKDQALRRSEKRFSELFQNMNEGFVLCSVTPDKSDLEILKINHSFLIQTGFHPETKVEGKKWTEVFPNLLSDVLYQFIRVGMTGVPTSQEIQSHGLKKWFYGRVYSPEKNHIAIIFEDITRRKMEEELIQRQKSELETAAVEKEKFYSMLVHDLRSPFHGLMSIAEILTDETEDLTKEEITKFAGQLGRSLTSMYGNINEMLEWFLFTRSGVEVKATQVDLYLVAQRSAALLQRGFEGKDILFDLEEKPGMMVLADHKNVESIFTNLLSNAIKFTPKGGRIGVRFSEEEEFVVCRICDTGIGIPVDVHETLFDPDKSFRRRGTEGESSSGLGLIHSKEIIKLHGGDLWFTSEEGKGTTFIFTLPKCRKI